MIAIALALAGLYRRVLFGAHLVFALHFASMMFLVTVLAVVVARLLGATVEAGFGVAYAALAVYLFVALKRVHPASTVSTAWKTVIATGVMILSNGLIGGLATRATFWLL